jgi:hypothetical protein
MGQSYFNKEFDRKQDERRSVQAGHLAACAEKWRQNPSMKNLSLMEHVMERIQQDEAMIHRREWNLKQNTEE